MDMGVIAALKLNYKSRLFKRISATIEHRNVLREGAKKLKAGLKGLYEGHDPHMLDVHDLIFKTREDVSEKRWSDAVSRQIFYRSAPAVI